MPRLMEKLKKAAHIYDRLEEGVLIVSFFVTVSLVAIQVVMRYIFNNSLSWSEELTRFIFVWQVWMGTSIAAKKNNHIRVEILSGALKGKGRILYDIFGDLLVFALTVFLVWNGFVVVGRMISLGTILPAMQAPMWLMYLSLPVSSVCVCVRLFCRTCGNVKKLLTGGDPDPTVPVMEKEG